MYAADAAAPLAELGAVLRAGKAAWAVLVGWIALEARLDHADRARAAFVHLTVAIVVDAGVDAVA